ncbi:MAG: peptidoglycan DD-metalloendopeptidase family protein [Deinococcota bacterium]
MSQDSQDNVSLGCLKPSGSESSSSASSSSASSNHQDKQGYILNLQVLKAVLLAERMLSAYFAENDVHKKNAFRDIYRVHHPRVHHPNVRRLALIGLVVGILVSLTTSLAQGNATTNELERDIATYQESLQVREQEQAEIEARLGELAEELAARVAERDQISNELVGLRRDRSAIEDDISSLESQVAANEIHIAGLEARLEVLEARLEAMLISLHRQRDNRYARALAGAESFFELRVRNHYLSQLATQDVNILEDIRTTVRQLADAQAQLAEQVSERNSRLDALQATEIRLASVRDELAAVISELETSQEGQLALRQDAINSQNDLEATIAGARRALNAERARLEREAAEARRRAREAAAAQRRNLLDEAEQTEAAAAALAVPTRPLEDGYALPFPNPQLARRYGEEGPFVFLRAEQDYTAVRAVKSGVVQIVQPVQANTGYLVVVAHDSELLSAYQNLQAPQLEIGDWVNQGDIIGYLGGGTLIPANTLKFFIGLSQAGGGAAWVDPSTRLGFE